MRDVKTGLVLLATTVGCAAPAVVREIEAAHPGAHYDAIATGCGAGAPTGRRFGPDLWLAVLWSRQVVRSARQLPCEAVIQAVTGTESRPVYRVRWPRDAPLSEGPVPR